jgi:hypothetical protein
MRNVLLEIPLCLALAVQLLIAQMQPLAHAQSSQTYTIQQESWQLLQLANQARAANGAGPLRWDPALAVAARQHCLRMAAEGPISHQYRGEPDVSERAGQAGAHFSLIEENVAFGPTPSIIHDSWMHSPGHRTNLMNPQVDRVGVAVVASRGELYAVADYERAVPVLAQADVEASVAKRLRAQGLAILADPTVAREYCADEREGFKGSSPPGFIMRWQDADLTVLPQALLDRVATGNYRQAAVGSCPTRGLAGTFTAYRLAVLLY